MEIVGLKQIFENDVKNNRMQKKENKNIINMFLGNIKDTKTEIIQKRELPKLPVIPALINKLPDSINNMIFYYVGYKSRLSKMMKNPIQHIPIYLRNKRERIVRYACRLYCNTLDMNTEEPSREDLLKLPQWVRQKINAYLGDKSLRKQMIGLGVEQYSRLWLRNPRLARRMEEEAEDKRRDLTKQLQLSQTYYNYFDRHYINERRLIKEKIKDCNDECDFID
jgi:hypothetical protein